MDSTALDIDIQDNPPKIYSDQELAELHRKPLSYAQIQECTGIPRATVHQRVTRYVEEVKGVKEYKLNRADNLARQQRDIDGFITPDKLKKSSAAQLVLMKCQLYDKERIERGLSTENIAYKDYTPQVTDLDNQIKALEAKIQGTEATQAPLQDDRDTTQDSTPIEDGEGIT